jgi:hypothetical protein
MAVIIADKTNCPTQHFDLQDDLGFGSATILEDATRTLTEVIKTDRPLKVRVGIELTSGEGTLEISVHSAADNASFGSPTASLTCEGTDGKYVDVVTSLATPYVSLRFVDTSDTANTVVASGFVEVKGLQTNPSPGGYHSSAHAFNGIHATTGGDYSCALS